MRFIMGILILGSVSLLVNILLQKLGVDQGSQMVMAIAIGFFGGFMLPPFSRDMK